MSMIEFVQKTIKCCICKETYDYEEPANSQTADTLPDGYLVPYLASCNSEDHPTDYPTWHWVCDKCGSCSKCGRSLEKEPEKRGTSEPCRYCLEGDST